MYSSTSVRLTSVAGMVFAAWGSMRLLLLREMGIWKGLAACEETWLGRADVEMMFKRWTRLNV